MILGMRHQEVTWH